MNSSIIFASQATGMVVSLIVKALDMVHPFSGLLSLCLNSPANLSSVSLPVLLLSKTHAKAGKFGFSPPTAQNKARDANGQRITGYSEQAKARSWSQVKYHWFENDQLTVELADFKAFLRHSVRRLFPPLLLVQHLPPRPLISSSEDHQDDLASAGDRQLWVDRQRPYEPFRFAL